MSSFSELVTQLSKLDNDHHTKWVEVIGEYIDNAMEHEDAEVRPTVKEMKRLFDFVIYLKELALI